MGLTWYALCVNLKITLTCALISPPTTCVRYYGFETMLLTMNNFSKKLFAYMLYVATKLLLLFSKTFFMILKRQIPLSLAIPSPSLEPNSSLDFEYLFTYANTFSRVTQKTNPSSFRDSRPSLTQQKSISSFVLMCALAFRRRHCVS